MKNNVMFVAHHGSVCYMCGTEVHVSTHICTTIDYQHQYTNDWPSYCSAECLREDFIVDMLNRGDGGYVFWEERDITIHHALNAYTKIRSDGDSSPQDK